MLRRRSFLGLVSGVILSTFGLAAHAEETIVLKLGHGQPLSSPAVKIFEKVVKEVSERTNGHFVIELESMIAHGFKQSDSLRLVAHQKAYDIVHHFPPYVVRDEPLYDIGTVPTHGLVNAEDNAKLIDVQREIAQEVSEKWGLEMIGFHHVEGDQKRLYILSKKPFESLEDLKSIKLRHWSRSGVEIFSAAGVPTQIIPSTELFLALQNGTIDATVYPVNYAAATSLNEVTDYISYVTPFVASVPTGYLARKETWDKIPEEYKKVWNEVLDEEWAAAIASYEKDEIEPKLLKDLEAKGMTVLPPLPEEDRRLLQKEALRQWRENAERIGPKAVEYYDRIVAVLELDDA